MKNLIHFHLKIERVNDSFFLYLNDDFISFSKFNSFLKTVSKNEVFSFDVLFDSVEIISGHLVFDDKESFMNRINFLASGKVPKK